MKTTGVALAAKAVRGHDPPRQRTAASRGRSDCRCRRQRSTI